MKGSGIKTRRNIVTYMSLAIARFNRMLAAGETKGSQRGLETQGCGSHINSGFKRNRRIEQKRRASR